MLKRPGRHVPKVGGEGGEDVQGPIASPIGLIISIVLFYLFIQYYAVLKEISIR